MAAIGLAASGLVAIGSVAIKLVAAALVTIRLSAMPTAELVVATWLATVEEGLRETLEWV